MQTNKRTFFHSFAVHFSSIYTGCPGRNGKNFGRVFLMLKYTDITQITCIQIWTVTEIKAREKCVQFRVFTHCACQLTALACPSFSKVSYYISRSLSNLHTFMLIRQSSLRIRCEWLVTFRVTSALCDSYSMYSVWNPYGQLRHYCECFCNSI
jgi:hypothetical protein